MGHTNARPIIHAIDGSLIFVFSHYFLSKLPLSWGVFVLFWSFFVFSLFFTFFHETSPPRLLPFHFLKGEGKWDGGWGIGMDGLLLVQQAMEALKSHRSANWADI